MSPWPRLITRRSNHDLGMAIVSDRPSDNDTSTLMRSAFRSSMVSKARNMEYPVATAEEDAVARIFSCFPQEGLPLVCLCAYN